MKKYLWKLATCACIGLLSTGYTSCEEDKTNTQEKNLDSQAGTFKLKNIADSNQEPSNEIIAIPGDTIKVIFEPKSEYRAKGFRFTLSCSGLDQLSANNDSMYVVNRNSKSGKLQVSLTAKYENKSNEEITTFSAFGVGTINVQSESYITVPYQLQVSEDLLQFVTPEISYNDPLGNKRTYRLEYDDMVHSDSVTNSYTHNGTVENITYLPNAKYSFKLRYTSLPATTEVTVRYIPKDNVEITRNDYDFQHSFDRMSASGVLYDNNGGITIIIGSYTSINLDFTGSKKRTEQETRQYIENLSRTPDVKRWSISARGEIEEIKDVQSESYITVPYQLQVSEDLLQFVTPEISYNDPLGNKRTYRLEYDDMVHSDSVTNSYTHNGTVENITYLPNAKYSFKLRYTSLPATTEVTVRYIPKDNVEITRNDYDFQHGFDRMSASGIIYDNNGGATVITDIYSNFSITVDFKGPQKQTEQDIRQYIENLSRTPDVKRWSISAKGEIEEVKD